MQVGYCAFENPYDFRGEFKRLGLVLEPTNQVYSFSDTFLTLLLLGVVLTINETLMEHSSCVWRHKEVDDDYKAVMEAANIS